MVPCLQLKGGFKKLLGNKNALDINVKVFSRLVVDHIYVL